MGLLDIWNDWKKENQMSRDGFEDYLPNNEGTGTLDTASLNFIFILITSVVLSFTFVSVTKFSPILNINSQ